jgi:hypothetical protein
MKRTCCEMPSSTAKRSRAPLLLPIAENQYSARAGRFAALNARRPRSIPFHGTNAQCVTRNDLAVLASLQQGRDQIIRQGYSKDRVDARRAGARARA